MLITYKFKLKSDQMFTYDFLRRKLERYTRSGILVETNCPFELKFK